jgi:hypothetical protein
MDETLKRSALMTSSSGLFICLLFFASPTAACPQADQTSITQNRAQYLLHFPAPAA